MFRSGKDRYTEMFRVMESADGKPLKNKNGWFKTKSMGRHRNPAYVPGGLKKRPLWCKKRYGKAPSRLDMTPCPDCLYDKCPFLAYTAVEEEEYKVMVGAWEKASKRGEFKHLEDLDTLIKTPQDANAPKKTTRK